MLRLLRLPGVFTAFADILAGFFIVRLAGLDSDPIGTLPYMLLVSACLYAGGMAWNDLFDAEEDARYRPTRPIPAGQINMSAAFFIACILAICALMLAMVGGLAPFLTASLLLLMTLLYNAVLKKNCVLGPLSMGLCRGLNLFLGMCGHASILYMTDDPRVFLPPLFLTAYIAVITVISRMESDEEQARQDALPEPGPSQILSTELDELPEHISPPDSPEEGMRLSELRRKRDLELLLRQNKVTAPRPLGSAADAPPPPTEADTDPYLLWFACVALVAVALGGGYVMAGHWLGLALFGALLAWLALPVYRVLKIGSGPAAKQLVGAGIMGVCLLDAAFIASVAQTPLGNESLVACAVVAAMIVPASILRRYISVT